LGLSVDDLAAGVGFLTLTIAVAAFTALVIDLYLMDARRGAITSSGRRSIANAMCGISKVINDILKDVIFN
jgi:hypothetical protein